MAPKSSHESQPARQVGEYRADEADGGGDDGFRVSGHVSALSVVRARRPCGGPDPGRRPARHRFDLVRAGHGGLFLDPREDAIVRIRSHLTPPELSERVVFITGDIVSAELETFLVGTGRPYIAKPFEFTAVIDILPRKRVA